MDEYDDEGQQAATGYADLPQLGPQQGFGPGDYPPDDQMEALQALNEYRDPRRGLARKPREGVPDGPQRGAEYPPSVSDATSAYQSTINGYQDTVFPERPEAVGMPDVGGEAMPGGPEPLGMPGSQDDYSWEGHMARAREWQGQYEAEHGKIPSIVPGYGNMQRFLNNQGPSGSREYRGPGVGPYGTGHMTEMGAQPVMPGGPLSGSQGSLGNGQQSSFHGMLEDGMNMLNGLASHVMTNPAFAQAPQQKAAALSKIMGEAAQLAKLGVRGGKNGEGLFNENFSGHQQAELTRLGAQETQARQMHAQGDINDNELGQWMQQLEARRGAIQPSSLTPNSTPPAQALLDQHSVVDEHGIRHVWNPGKQTWTHVQPPKKDPHDSHEGFKWAVDTITKADGAVPTMDDPRLGALVQSYLGYQHGLPIAGQHPSQQQPGGMGGQQTGPGFGMAGGAAPQAPGVAQPPAMPKNPKLTKAASDAETASLKARGIMNEKEWSDQRQKIVKEIDSRIHQQASEAANAKSKGTEFSPSLTPDMRSDAISEEMAQHGLGRGTYQHYREARDKGLPYLPGHGPAYQKGSSDDSAQRPAPTQGQQQGWEARMPQAMAAFRAVTEKANTAGDGDAWRASIEAWHLYREAKGDPNALGPDARAKYIDYLRLMKKHQPNLQVPGE